jgi:toxin ParE1/3/4
VSSYVLSEAADTDIERILIDSIRRWGIPRAERYILELHRAFETLAAFPDIGQSVSHLRTGYFWFQHAGHSVFYKKSVSGIVIIRVLHQRQLPSNHL